MNGIPPMTTDVYKYSGPIELNGYQSISNLLKNKQSENALLILATAGGDPHAGFRIARALQSTYGSFKILIPRYCKSAGTLVAIGADQLFLDDMSELGPLDVQVKKDDEIMGRNSGLDILHGVNLLQNQALSAFRSHLVELTRDAGLSTKIASDISSKLTTGLFEPIFAQIDPIKLSEIQRAMDIAFAYGARLNEKSQNLRQDGLHKLVTSYPSHAFVIDRKEAKSIFTKVEKPTGLLKQLSEAFMPSMDQTMNNSPATVELLCMEFDLKDQINSNNPSTQINNTNISTANDPQTHNRTETLATRKPVAKKSKRRI